MKRTDGQDYELQAFHDFLQMLTVFETRKISPTHYRRQSVWPIKEIYAANSKKATQRKQGKGNKKKTKAYEALTDEKIKKKY